MLRLLNRNKSFVGLDIGSNALKAVELRLSRGNGVVLVGLGFEEISPDCIVDGVILSPVPVSDTIRRILSAPPIRNGRVFASVAGHSVIVKKISLPAQRDEDLAESIRCEAEQHIPFDVAEVNLAYQVLGENTQTGHLDIVLVAAKKDKITDYASVIRMAGKIPAAMDVDAFALQNAYEHNYEPSAGDIVALLDIGASTMTIHIVSGTDLLFTRDIGVGGNHYTERIKKEFHLSHGQAQALKHGEAVGSLDPAQARPVIDSVTEIMGLEIQKTCDFFKSTTAAGPIDRMVISGGAAHTPGLIETLSRKFGIPAEKFDSFRKIGFDSRQFASAGIADRAPDLAVAIGLALRGATRLSPPGFIKDRHSRQNRERL